MSLDDYKDCAASIIGCSAVSISLVTFLIPNDISPGGISGLAAALQHITSISVGGWSLILNVPVFIVAFRILGFRPLLKTAISTILLSVLIDLFSPFLPKYTENILVSSVFGGALAGLGIGLLLVRGLSTGGTDLICLLLYRKFVNISVGNILLFIDGFVVIIAVIIFHNIDVALYSIITIYITSKTVDSVVQGSDYAKVIYAITEKGELISKSLFLENGRGITLIPSIGAYTGTGKTILTTIVRRNSLTQTLSTIKQLDPNAFIFVVNTTEVHGEGFKK